MAPIADRRDTFRRLHESGCFVIPNPWDLGSARLLAGLGFRALATTSSGFAWSLGRPDNRVTLDEALAHLRAIAGGVELPVNADFEGGFAVEPAAVGANVMLATGTGIAGISIEDSTGDAAHPLFDFGLAVERVRAARAAIDASGTGVLLTGRSARRSGGSRPTPRRARTACTRRGSGRGTTSGWWWPRSRRCRSTCSSGATSSR